MNYDLIVIGASWGGLHAVGEILGALPAEARTKLLDELKQQPDGAKAVAELEK